VRELVLLLDALLLEGIEECVDCDVSKAVRVRILFEEEENDDVPGWFMGRVEVFVSPYNRKELCEVVATFSARIADRLVSAWRTVFEDGHQLMTMAEAAAECEAELRTDHPRAFLAYDAYREQQELAATLPRPPGGTVPRL
jgi:hypothetical protein